MSSIGVSMSFIRMCFMFLLISVSGLSFSAQSVGEVKSTFVEQMTQNGYITKGQAQEIKNKLITSSDFSVEIQSQGVVKGDDTIQKTVSEHSLLSFSNFLIIAGIFLVVAFFWKSIKNLILQVPAIIYQAVFLSISIFATIYPEKFSSQYAFYVVLFASIMNLVIIGWIAATYSEITEKILGMFKFLEKIGLRPETVLSAWLMVYFGFFAITYQSQLFGFFATIAFSSIFSFVIVSFPGMIGLGQTRNIPAALIVGHLAAFAAFIVMGLQGVATQYTQYFATGIQYYCTLAIGVTLLIQSSFWSKDNRGIYIMAFIALTLVANFFAATINLTATAAIMNILIAIWIIEWVGYVSFSAGALAGLLFSGVSLIGLGIFIDKYSAPILTALTTTM